MEKVVRFGSVVIVRTVKTGQYDTGCTPKRIVIPMVSLYIKSRVGLIGRKKEVARKGRRGSTLRAK